MPHLVTGILAHVDAGKTTLSEALLYETGAIRTLGRVDSKNSFLDNNSIERERGITIFSKQAVLNEKITLIDTPGHVDFSAEMERTLSILDAAILLVNGADGIQPHTRTLWSLLQKQGIPVLIFVNKMDMSHLSRGTLLSDFRSTFSDCVVDFSDETFGTPEFFEACAGCDEVLLESFLDGSNIPLAEIGRCVVQRKIFPCLFGSALKLEGVSSLLKILSEFFYIPDYTDDFSCRVFKISKDAQGNRLTHLKVCGGVLKVKDQLDEEKVNEIRLYSGNKFDSVKEIGAGEVCSVTGLKNSIAGKCYGSLKPSSESKIQGALVYSVQLPDEIDVPGMLKVMRELEEELPELKVDFSEASGEIVVVLMGEVQTEVLRQLVLERYKLKIEFGEGRIAYKETILESVSGVGHYEPLRHYAEVQLRLTPLPLGSGLKFVSEVPVDELDTNWQRLILTHLAEKQHAGVLTGSPITDMELRVIAGRAHLKHTEGGDFRQATYRAIRHGLMYAKSVLLEPVYSFEIIAPENCVGRVMSDVDRMHGTCSLDESKNGFSVLRGRCPVATMKNYINELRSFSKGQGMMSIVVDGYEKCHNESEIVTKIGYNPERDVLNPASSVFCSHGAGFVVPWDKVNEFKHT